MIVAYFWRIKPSRLPFAIKAMGFDRFSLLRDKNVSFHKSLGTGKGETFTPSDAHALQWGLGKEPFVATAKDWNGQVAAITRARIKWSQNFRFWSSVPPVTVSLKAAPGLVAAIGIGEAPIGLQGTFSLWESAAAIREFAYKGAAHQKAIADTSAYNWYSEELFARFAVREVRGSL